MLRIRKLSFWSLRAERVPMPDYPTLWAVWVGPIYIQFWPKPLRRRITKS